VHGPVGSVMNAYNEIDGIPCGSDQELLTRLLRDDWGFAGTVVSDYWSIAFLASTRNIAPDVLAAAQDALRTAPPDGCRTEACRRTYSTAPRCAC